MASRLAALALGLSLLFAGCTESAPTIDDSPSPRPTPTVSRTPLEERAKQRLMEALGQLAAEAGIHYKGSLQVGPTQWTDLDLRVTSSGVAYGSMTRRNEALRVLVLDSETVLIRAGVSYWASELRATSDPADVPKKAEFYARHWARVDPEVVSRAGDVLRPASVAAQVRRLVDEDGVRSVRTGAVGGEAVDVITVGDSVFHVTKAEPARLLRMRLPRLSANGGTGISDWLGSILGSSLQHSSHEHFSHQHFSHQHGGADIALLSFQEPNDEDDEGEDEGEGEDSSDGVGPDEEDAVDVDGMDLSDLVDLYDELSQMAASGGLAGALDARVDFNIVSDVRLRCPTKNSGNCQVNATVANTVTGVRGQVAGEVTAELDATVTGPLNTDTCKAKQIMLPNSRAHMSCGVNLLLPPCRRRGGCVWPATGVATVYAKAVLDPQYVRKLLDQKRHQDVARLESQPAPHDLLQKDLRNYKAQYFRIGNDTFILPKERLEHILMRHHHRYWGGEQTTTRQDFFPGDPSIDEVLSIIARAIKQERRKLVGLGQRHSPPLCAVVDGQAYKFVIDKGVILQFTPAPACPTEPPRR